MLNLPFYNIFCLNNVDEKKKKIKNLFASDERLDDVAQPKKHNADQPRQVHIIRLKESSKLNKKNSTSQFFNDEIIGNNNTSTSEPYERCEPWEPY